MNLKKKIKGKLTALILGAALIFALALITFVEKPSDENSRKDKTGPAYTEEISSSKNTVPVNTGSQLSEDKNETVYAKADAEGIIREVTVEAVLKQETGSSEIKDVSDLGEIKNTKGDETFRIETGNTILWENHGEDIHYKGKSSKELPIEVKISYFLNGRQMTPEELAGKSGRVKIRFDYVNRSSLTEQTAPVPFMVASAVLLPEEVFSNIEIVNGKQLSLEGQSIAVGYAYPGLADYLKLSAYEPTKEVKIPEYMEISADAVDFELDFTATVVTTGSLADLETEDLDEIQEWIDSMDELQDASTELVSGTAELLEGVEEFQEYLKEYADGAEAIKDGAKALREGLGMLDSRKGDLETGAKALKSGLENLNAALEEMLAQMTKPNLTTKAGEESGKEDASQPAQEQNPDPVQAALLEKLTQLELPEDLTEEQKAKVLESVMKFLSEELGGSDAELSYAASLQELQSGIGQLAEGSRQLSEGIAAFNEGIWQLYEGSAQLYAGTKEFASAGDELYEGFGEAADGVRSLKDGMTEFDREGIQELSRIAGPELETILIRLRALKEADSQYQSFSGLAEGKTGSVKFIIETDEIKK